MSESQLPLMVADASVTLKWLLTDEPFAMEAIGIVQAFRGGKVRLIARDHMRYEIANALRVARRANRLTEERAEEALAEFLSLQLPLNSSDGLLLAGFEYSARFGCAVYDALYLALADSAECPFVHADRRLRNTLSGRFGRELWIGNYSPGDG